MPEGYTHARIALAAAQAAGWDITSRAAYLAGANGPDMLYCFEAWKPAARRRMNLTVFGYRMHAERTGAFLQALCRHAVTPVQKDYFLGFLCHYATDTTVHPYVEMLTKCCPPYAGPAGHGYFEVALDSYLHKKDTGRAAVPVDDMCPLLTGTALADVNAQLQAAIQETYGVEIKREYLADAFFDNYRIRRLFCAKTPLRRGVFWLIEPLVGGRGTLLSHLTPARLQGIGRHDSAKGISLPGLWRDPFTGAVREENIYQLLDQAQRYSTQLVQEATAPYTGVDLFWPLVGSKDYVQGIETPLSSAPAAEDSAPAAPAPQDAPAPETEARSEAAPADAAPEAAAPGETAAQPAAASAPEAAAHEEAAAAEFPADAPTVPNAGDMPAPDAPDSAPEAAPAPRKGFAAWGQRMRQMLAARKKRTASPAAEGSAPAAPGPQDAPAPETEAHSEAAPADAAPAPEAAPGEAAAQPAASAPEAAAPEEAAAAEAAQPAAGSDPTEKAPA